MSMLPEHNANQSHGLYRRFEESPHDQKPLLQMTNSVLLSLDTFTGLVAMPEREILISFESLPTSYIRDRDM
jgi:hypothetical protein